MQSSPGTPRGNGRRSESRTWIRVFATGRPIGMESSVAAQAQAVTSMAASVGP